MSDALALRILMEGGAAAFIAVAFAMLFAVPARFLPYVALGGALTRMLRTALFSGAGTEVAVATFLSCAVTSLLFIWVAPRLCVPRPVASVIPLIPGMDAYTCLVALYGVIDDPQRLIDQNAYLIVHHGMRCFAILLSICLGIAIPPLFFYRLRSNGV